MEQGVIAKFRCNSLTVREDSREVHLSPVYQGSDPTSENSRFWKATPSGEIKMAITNPGAYNQFEPGAEYYVEFRPAKTTPAASV